MLYIVIFNIAILNLPFQAQGNTIHSFLFIHKQKFPKNDNSWLLTVLLLCVLFDLIFLKFSFFLIPISQTKGTNSFTWLRLVRLLSLNFLLGCFNLML